MRPIDRRRIFARDKYRCVACKSRKFVLVAHHVIPEPQGGADNEQNVVTLCRPCHLAVTGFRMYREVRPEQIRGFCSMYLSKLFGSRWNPYSREWQELKALQDSLLHRGGERPEPTAEERAAYVEAVAEREREPFDYDRQ